MGETVNREALLTQRLLHDTPPPAGCCREPEIAARVPAQIQQFTANEFPQVSSEQPAASEEQPIESLQLSASARFLRGNFRMEDPSHIIPNTTVTCDEIRQTRPWPESNVS